MKNQISGSISLDVSSLAEGIAERLLVLLPTPASVTPSAPLASTPVAIGPNEAILYLSNALNEQTSEQISRRDYLSAAALMDSLAHAGYILCRHAPVPARTETPAPDSDVRSDSWFDRPKD